MTIQPGQTYRACDGSGRRIRIVKDAPGYPTWGWSKTTVETLLADGRGIRQRAIETTQLHESATTADGQPRLTGYALEQP
ncbi:hypothetical protein ACFCYX_19320 [Streptomyces populi]|uniref:hypothetical protein n=1 Tax=Streptomyces populi TaxID=2058924 RepID=UPI0035DF43C7